MKSILIALAAAVALAACDISMNEDFKAKQAESLKQQAELDAYCKDPAHEQEEKCRINRDMQKP